MEEFSKLVYFKKLHGVEMKASTYRVLVTVFDYTNKYGKRAWPGVDNLSRDTCLSKSQVKRCLSELEQAGWLRKTKRGGRSGDGTTRATEYELTTPSTAHGCDVDYSELVPQRLISASSTAHSERLNGSFEAPQWLTGEPPSESSSESSSEHAASDDPWGSWLRDRDDCPI